MNLSFLLVSACLIIIQDQLGGGTLGQLLGNQYIAQQGDTLQSIAQRLCGTALRWTEIRDLNRLPGETVVAGTALILPPTCTGLLRSGVLGGVGGIREDMDGLGQQGLAGGMGGVRTGGVSGIREDMDGLGQQGLAGGMGGVRTGLDAGAEMGGSGMAGGVAPSMGTGAGGVRVSDILDGLEDPTLAIASVEA